MEKKNYPPLVPPTGGRAIKVAKPDEIPYVYEGRFCGKCKFFQEPTSGREYLIKKGFWEKAFHNYDDGHDFKPWHFGDLRDYSICNRDGATVHVFSTCPYFKEKKAFLKMFRGEK